MRGLTSLASSRNSLAVFASESFCIKIRVVARSNLIPELTSLPTNDYLPSTYTGRFATALKLLLLCLKNFFREESPAAESSESYVTCVLFLIISS